MRSPPGPRRLAAACNSMADGLSALGWLVVVCAGALGFGLVKFLIVTLQAPREEDAPAAPAEAPRDDPG